MTEATFNSPFLIDEKVIFSRPALEVVEQREGAKDRADSQNRSPLKDAEETIRGAGAILHGDEKGIDRVTPLAVDVLHGKVDLLQSILKTASKEERIKIAEELDLRLEVVRLGATTDVSGTVYLMSYDQDVRGGVMIRIPHTKEPIQAAKAFGWSVENPRTRTPEPSDTQRKDAQFIDIEVPAALKGLADRAVEEESGAIRSREYAFSHHLPKIAQSISMSIDEEQRRFLRGAVETTQLIGTFDHAQQDIARKDTVTPLAIDILRGRFDSVYKAVQEASTDAQREELADELNKRLKTVDVFVVARKRDMALCTHSKYLDDGHQIYLPYAAGAPVTALKVHGLAFENPEQKTRESFGDKKNRVKSVPVLEAVREVQLRVIDSEERRRK